MWQDAVGFVKEAGLLRVLLAAAGFLFALSLVLARVAAKPRKPRVKRRSFAAGLARGRAAQAASVEEALERLRAASVGTFRSASRQQDGGVRVALARKANEPCEFASGYLVGVFESAWACDVAITHDACPGKREAGTCWYVLTPVKPSAGRTEEARIRG